LSQSVLEEALQDQHK